MRGHIAVAALVGLYGCASFAPLDEAERARIRVVAPAPAQFPPNVEFKIPPGKGEGAAKAGTAGAVGAAYASLMCGPFFGACFALVAPVTIVFGAAFGAAVTPSNEEIEAMVERARSHLGAPDVQQLLMQRFSERVTRLTSHTIDLSASKHGPQSPDDTPSYSGMAAGEGTLVAEVAVGFVGATLVEPFELFGTDYASRPLRIGLNARMRLVRPSDGATVMTRYYFVARYGRRIQEYQEDGARLLQAVSGAVDEIATLMVDDAFLFRSDAASAGGAWGPAVTALEPLPSSLCLQTGYDCWAFIRVPRLDTASPRFRWKPFPEPGHLESAPRLRAARNIVYDLWIFGGDDDRVVEGLKTTEHTLERPLAPCMRYSWAVRARFETDSGPRTVEWSTASGNHRSAFLDPAVRPTFGAPFITPCPAKAGGLQPGSDKPERAKASIAMRQTESQQSAAASIYPRALTDEELVAHLRNTGKVEVKAPIALMSLTFLPGNRFKIVYESSYYPSGALQEGTYSLGPNQDLVCFRILYGDMTHQRGPASQWISDCFRVSQIDEKTYSLKTSKGDHSFTYSVR